SPKDKRIEAICNRKIRQVFCPLAQRPSQDALCRAVRDDAVDVKNSADVVRVAACLSHNIIDPFSHLSDLRQISTKGRHPAICYLSCQPERLGTIDTQPNANRMGRYGSRMSAT